MGLQHRFAQVITLPPMGWEALQALIRAPTSRAVLLAVALLGLGRVVAAQDAVPAAAAPSAAARPATRDTAAAPAATEPGRPALEPGVGDPAAPAAAALAPVEAPPAAAGAVPLATEAAAPSPAASDSEAAALAASDSEAAAPTAPVAPADPDVQAPAVADAPPPSAVPAGWRAEAQALGRPLAPIELLELALLIAVALGVYALILRGTHAVRRGGYDVERRLLPGAILTIRGSLRAGDRLTIGAHSGVVEGVGLLGLRLRPTRVLVHLQAWSAGGAEQALRWLEATLQPAP